MDKIATWDGSTNSHGFNLDVLRDKTGEFVAQIQTSSPAFAQVLAPGASTPMMEFDEPEELRDRDRGALRERTRRRLAERCGKINQFIEK